MLPAKTSLITHRLVIDEYGCRGRTRRVEAKVPRTSRFCRRSSTRIDDMDPCSSIPAVYDQARPADLYRRPTSARLDFTTLARRLVGLELSGYARLSCKAILLPMTPTVFTGFTSASTGAPSRLPSASRTIVHVTGLCLPQSSAAPKEAFPDYP